MAALSAGLAFFLPFALEFQSAVDTAFVNSKEINATNNVLVLISIADIILCSFIAIFSFKNRKIQKVFSLIVVLLSAMCIAYMFFVAELQEENMTIRLGIIAPLLSLIFGILGFNGIRKDDKLVKDLDRLR